MTGSSLVAAQSLAALVRERTVLLIAGIFTAMVMVSAGMGWSTTATVNGIYADAVVYLQSIGQPVPQNPLGDTSALSVMRNLTVYVSLIGTFAAIVTGQRLIEADRRAGVLPLIAARPIARMTYVTGKMQALALATAALMALAAGISSLTLILLPGLSVTAGEWIRLGGFFGLSWVYITLFGMVALGAAARIPATAGGLLAATILWLAITFVLPALTGNVNPTAAINPISALVASPDTPVFAALGNVLGPFSLSEAYEYLSADLMGYLPAGLLPRGVVPPLASLIVAFGAALVFAVRSGLSLDSNVGGPDA
jgi:ABC-type transport system involved in multi-copper enzyme maturation permease subunit